MNSGGSDTIPNPFAVPLRSNRSAAKSAMLASLKLMLLIGLGLAAVLVIHRQTQSWLLHRWTQDFDQLPADQRISRLLDMATLGDVAIPHLVATLADTNVRVAQASLRILRDSQDDWELLPTADAALRHRKLVQTIHTHATRLSSDRTTWATGLVQTSLEQLKRLEGSNDAELNRRALATLQRLAISGRDDGRPAPGGSTASPRDERSGVRIVAKTRPLPLNESWDQPSASQPGVGPGHSTSAAAAKPEVTLNHVNPAAVRLKPVDPPSDTESTAVAREVTFADIQTTTHLIQSPMETLDDKSVVRFLADPNPELRESAELELRSRTWNSSKIELAGRMVTGSTASRLDLIDWLGSQTKFDPRGWLLLLLDDQDREIRHRIVSILSTMDDNYIQQRLSEHQLVENDPQIRTMLSGRSPVNAYRR